MSRYDPDEYNDWEGQGEEITMKAKRLDGDALHDRKEEIARQVHELVNKLTADLHEEDDSDLRQTLTEQFRFWRS